MIIPITIFSNGEDREIGTARVIPAGDDFSVELYLNSEFSFTDQVKADLTKELKKIARKRRDDSTKHLSICERE